MFLQRIIIIWEFLNVVKTRTKQTKKTNLFPCSYFLKALQLLAWQISLWTLIWISSLFSLANFAAVVDKRLWWSLFRPYVKSSRIGSVALGDCQGSVCLCVVTNSLLYNPVPNVRNIVWPANPVLNHNGFRNNNVALFFWENNILNCWLKQNELKYIVYFSETSVLKWLKSLQCKNLSLKKNNNNWQCWSFVTQQEYGTEIHLDH